MKCAICDFIIREPKPARHLPRFIRCPNCTGYVTEEKTDAAYPDTYFTEEPQRPEKKSVFRPMLDFFLWLRMRKIRRILKENTTPLTPPSTEGGRKREAREEVKRILDYGSGNGKLVAYLIHRGFEVEGYDPEPSAVSLAQRQGLPVFGAVPAKRYDLVMFWHSLEHSDTPLRGILTLKSRLTQHGLLLIAVPNGDSLEARIAGESFFCYDWPFHRVHFNPEALTALLEKAEFRVLSIDYFNPEYTVSSLAQTFLNLFLPKNALYSVVSDRRKDQGRATLFLTLSASGILLVLFSPLLLLVFLFALVTRKTAAFIVVAQRKI